MKYFLVFVLIVGMALLYAGAQEEVEEVIEEPALVQPIQSLVTRLKITLIDELSDQFIKLENGAVQIIGELHIAEDSFNYSNTFVEGDRYEIVVYIKLKK